MLHHDLGAQQQVRLLMDEGINFGGEVLSIFGALVWDVSGSGLQRAAPAFTATLHATTMSRSCQHCISACHSLGLWPMG